MCVQFTVCVCACELLHYFERIAIAWVQMNNMTKLANTAAIEDVVEWCNQDNLSNQRSSLTGTIVDWSSAQIAKRLGKVVGRRVTAWLQGICLQNNYRIAGVNLLYSTSLPVNALIYFHALLGAFSRGSSLSCGKVCSTLSDRRAFIKVASLRSKETSKAHIM